MGKDSYRATGHFFGLSYGLSDTGFCSAMRFEEVSGPMLSLIQISAAALSDGLSTVPSRIVVTL